MMENQRLRLDITKTMLFGYWGEGVDRIGFYGDWAGQAFEDSWAAWLVWPSYENKTKDDLLT